MDANTPATQSIQGGDPIQDKPSHTPPTQPNPAQPNPTQPNPAKPNPAQANPVQVTPQPDLPSRPKGPNAVAIVLGLVSLVLAGLIIANETTTWRIDWSGLGPGAIVIIGGVFLVIGAVGLIRRHDDS